MLKKSGFSRFMAHLLATPWQFKRHFSQQALVNIEKATAASERSHNGEIRVVVEGSLSPMHILQGVTPRHRAIELFSQLRVWDTAANNGVLIYLLLADRDVEIIADRGIHQRVGEAGWEAICREMEAMFRQGHFETGVLHGITRIGAALQQYFPPTSDDQNELPDAPLVL